MKREAVLLASIGREDRWVNGGGAMECDEVKEQVENNRSQVDCVVEGTSSNRISSFFFARQWAVDRGPWAVEEVGRPQEDPGQKEKGNLSWRGRCVVGKIGLGQGCEPPHIHVQNLRAACT